ncbi:DUF3617 domain-containing protein [Marinimicrobium sp. ARAG 43.8]|uniref:DUF3617 domain-containing protein n=1 Tax=Marinimicrobium sp. ARAG 43.8 TaxID=3418719 RepID=UPI003CFB4985
MKPYVWVAFITLCSIHAPLFAADLKPGEWESTVSMEGENLPPGMAQQKTHTECLSVDQTADVEKAMYETWTDNGCTNIEVDRDGDTVRWSAICNDGSFNSSGHMTLVDQEHYTSEIISNTGGMDLIVQTTAEWTGVCTE